MRTRNIALLASASLLALPAAGWQAQAADIFSPQPKAEQAHPLDGLRSVLSLWGGIGVPVTSDEDLEFAYANFGGNARVASANWQIELDLAAHSSAGGASDDSQYAAFGGHYLQRGTEQTSGIFGGLAVGTHVESDESSYHLFGGIEYARFNGMNTHFAQLGAIVGVAGDVSSTWESGVFFRGGWRHFYSPDSKLSLEGMLGAGGFSATEWGVTAAWGAEYERQMNGHPASWFAAYRGHYVEDSDSTTGANGTNHSLLVGFRLDVGPDYTLLDRDRSGAGTFDFPDLHRAISWIDTISVTSGPPPP